jgi:putative Mn2+ efflux pump MntP
VEDRIMKHNGLLTIGLGITSGTLLYNRFVYEFSDWIVYILVIIASACIIAAIRNKRDKKEN